MYQRGDKSLPVQFRKQMLCLWVAECERMIPAGQRSIVDYVGFEASLLDIVEIEPAVGLGNYGPTTAGFCCVECMSLAAW